MKCSHCPAENREGAEFCAKCGRPFQMEKTCQKCGHSNPLVNSFCDKCGQALAELATSPARSLSPQPSFAGGRYQVKKCLGEGGKKKVYLAHDNVLDRDVAFALIKTEKLEHYPDEKKEAPEHLDFAIKEFRQMKMQPSLERALRHKDILKA